MSPRITKKSVIREYLQRQRHAQVGPQEAAAIRQELVRVFGPQARISDDYLLDVLGQLGAGVAPELGGLSAEISGLLRFGTLESAEATLRALDQRYRDCRASDDRAGADECRRAAMLVRRRAAMLARNRKVSPEKRAEKEEIAQWFTIWLQTPDLFLDWLARRQQTDDFQKRFQPPAAGS